MLDKPVVMGILNATPDSFYRDSRVDAGRLLETAGKMLADGAVFIDVGGYSTRPGAAEVSENEEADRVLPLIGLLSKNFPDALVSVDTFRASVARQAVDAGAHLVNDVSSGDDDAEMMRTVAGLKVPYIMMHKKGTPRTMGSLAQYEDVTLEVLEYFNRKIAQAREAGITDLVLDPGFGFAKTMQHNYELLRRLADLRVAGLPLLVGVSRKKMIRDITGTDAGTALNGTTVVHTLALLNGAHILRVHDVKEAVESINIVQATYGNLQDL